MRVLYFASLRERMGRAEEIVAGDGIVTVGDLLTELRQRHGERADCLRSERVRVAVNQVLMPTNTVLAAGDEIAFLPPVTGG